MTDYTGLLQHSTFSVPNYHSGYSADDNARALIVALKIHRMYPRIEVRDLAKTYLRFLQFVQKRDGTFHNYIGFDRRVKDRVASWDCYGRIMWACGYTMDATLDGNIKPVAKQIYDDASRHIEELHDLRSLAFTVLGTRHYHDAYPKQQDLLEKIELMARRIYENYVRNAQEGWKWFEEKITYCNARLPQAMMVAFEKTGKTEFLDVGKESFEFLCEKTILGGIFVPIGQKRWYVRGGRRAMYDQQPIEASSMIEAAVEAFGLAREKKYAKIAKTCFEWFNGKNTKGIRLYDSETGGCFDGITAHGVNMNQGAESTVAYLAARLAMEELARKKAE
jgi:hypothetical protein